MADALRGGIIINEILADPTGAGVSTDTDGDGTARGADEYVELLNTSASAVDVGGLEFWDAQRDNWFTIPDGTILQPGGTLTVVRNARPAGTLPGDGVTDIAFDADFGSGVLGNNRDNVVIYDPDANAFIQATYNNDTLDDPTTGSNYAGFSATAVRVGAGEDFGTDIDGRSIQRGPNGNDDFFNDLDSTPGAGNVCFTPGVRIATPTGPRPVEHLRPGDLVITRDAGVRPVRWVGGRHLPVEELRRSPHLCPIRIAAGALGLGLPRRTLHLSPQHRILRPGPLLEMGLAEVLVAGRHLLGRPGIRQVEPAEGVHYLHFALDAHHVVFAEGLPAETLHFGPEARRVLGPGQVAELRNIFPGLDLTGRRTARPVLEGVYTRLAR